MQDVISSSTFKPLMDMMQELAAQLICGEETTGTRATSILPAGGGARRHPAGQLPEYGWRSRHPTPIWRGRAQKSMQKVTVSLNVH